MDVYFRQPEVYQRKYNCTFYNINDVPLEKRRHVVHGWIIITLFVIYEFTYLLCLFPIYKNISKTSCYKFMFVMALIDVSCLWINGLLTGVLAIDGAIFCSYPNLIYITGALATGMWASESMMAVLLAFNRCIEISSPILAQKWFSGWRTWVWVAIPSIYFFNVTFFSMPVIFSGIYVGWFVNPYVGIFDDFGDQYYNPYIAPHNSMVVIGLVGSYFMFCAILFIKNRRYAYANQNIIAARNNANAPKSEKMVTSKTEKMMFSQVLVISLINIVAAALYIFMQFCVVTEFLIYVATYTWLSAHGIPGLIYFCMNNTIRKEWKHWLNWRWRNSKRSQVTDSSGVPALPLGSHHRWVTSSTRKK